MADNIHASCVAIGTRGVLLLGASGVGKSSVALQLIDGGARLVADDRTLIAVKITAKAKALYASAPATIAGLIEIHGVGIVELPARARVKLALAVLLGAKPARMPLPAHFTHAGVTLPQIGLDARDPATPARIRAALAAHSKGLFRDTFITK